MSITRDNNITDLTKAVIAAKAKKIVPISISSANARPLAEAIYTCVEKAVIDRDMVSKPNEQEISTFITHCRSPLSPHLVDLTLLGNNLKALVAQNHAALKKMKYPAADTIFGEATQGINKALSLMGPAAAMPTQVERVDAQPRTSWARV